MITSFNRLRPEVAEQLSVAYYRADETRTLSYRAVSLLFPARAEAMVVIN
jgi:hypothetical protein